MEAEDDTKKLLDALVQVRPASIPRWNEHKDVKEDKERDPCVFIPHDKTASVDPSRKIAETAPKSAKPSMFGGKDVDQLAAGTIVNLAAKSFKKENKEDL